MQLKQIEVKTVFIYRDLEVNIYIYMRQLDRLYLYMQNLLLKYSMEDSKPISVPMGTQFKLSTLLSLRSDEEELSCLMFPILVEQSVLYLS